MPLINPDKEDSDLQYIQFRLGKAEEGTKQNTV